MAENPESQTSPDPWQEELNQLERWVREGRPDLVRQNLVANELEPWGNEERIDAMARAMDVACQMGPEHLIRVAFERMFRTCFLLQIRLECGIEPVVVAWGPGKGEAVRQLQADILPNVQKLQRHICEISKIYASIRHLLALSAPPDSEALKRKVFKLAKDTAQLTQAAQPDAPETKVG